MRDLSFRLHALGNGLRVLLHRDPRLPRVALEVRYDVGSKDDPPGLFGLAHLFEHLMFMGTEHIGGDEFDRLIEAHGGSANASTSADATSYVSEGPSSILPLLIWGEADRLRGVGRAMTAAKIARQRDVVLNELRQSYDNVPYGRAWLELSAIVYPIGHPYHHPVIGNATDLRRVGVEHARAFFEAHYAPCNATLAVAGDFEPDVVLRLVEEAFGDLPGGRAATQPPCPQPLRATRVESELVEDVPAARVHMVWPTPSFGDAADAGLDLLATILADGPASRLDLALIQDADLAHDVAASQESGRYGSEFSIVSTARPGGDLAPLEARLRAEVERLRRDGPTEDELERALAVNDTEFSRGLQTLSERADALITYDQAFGDAGAVGIDLARYRGHSRASLRALARDWLAPGRAGVLRVRPTNSSQPRPPRAFASRPPIPAETPPFRPPLPVVTPLAADGTSWWVEGNDSPLCAVSVGFPGGSSTDEVGREGRASLAAEWLLEGTRTLDAAGFADRMDRLGAEFDITTSRTRWALDLSVSADSLVPAVAALAEMLETPALHRDDFERLRALRLANLERQRNDPNAIAAIVAHRWLYGVTERGSHGPDGYARAVADLESHDVREVARRLSQGGCSAIVVAAGPEGATSIDRLRPLLRGNGNGAVRARPPRHGPLDLVVVARADAPQTVVRFVRAAPPLEAPESPALWLAANALGGTFTSRLNGNLRERNGFTYGASAALRQDGHSGVFSVATSVDSTVAEAALEEFFREMDRLTVGDFSDDEVALARANEQASIVADFQTVTGIVGQYASFALAGLPRDALVRSIAALAGATRAEVNQAARCLDGSEGVLVLVGPPEVVLRAAADRIPRRILVDEEGRPLTGNG